MRKLKAIWELMRLEHGVMLFIAILIGSVISQKMLYNFTGVPARVRPSDQRGAAGRLRRQ